jgi:D-hydroxyproline dehydrogenase subunit gamma
MATTPDALRLDTNVERGRPIQISVDGEPVQAYEGETVAAALLAAGRPAFRHTGPEGQPRGVFCGMGICYDCLVAVAGQDHVRACMTLVEPEMQVTTLRV